MRDSGSETMEVSFVLNKKKRKIVVHPLARLLDVLREEFQLTGSKEGCGEGECGACSIFVDGQLVNSCLIPVAQIQGARIETIEGLCSKSQYRKIQTSFLECGGTQCGICTPGMLMAAYNILRDHKKPNLDDLKEGLAGNLCRCTGYTKIFDSVFHAAKKRKSKKK